MAWEPSRSQVSPKRGCASERGLAISPAADQATVEDASPARERRRKGATVDNPIDAPTSDTDNVICDGDPASLLAAHDQLVKQLHRASDDFAATRELKRVIAALQRVPLLQPVITSASR